MQTLGSVLLWIWVAVWGTVLFLLGIVAFLVANPLVDPRRRAQGFIGHLWGRGILLMLPRIEVQFSGLERLQKGPFVVCANHQSVADIVVLVAAWAQFKFVVKDRFFRVPVLGQQLRLSGFIPTGSGASGESDRMLSHAAHWLALGCHVLVFPEGTRSRDGQLLRFRRGPFQLARRAGVPVLPVAILGTGDVLPKGAFRYNFRGKVEVRVLEPIDASGEPGPAAARARELIRLELETMRTPARVAVPT